MRLPWREYSLAPHRDISGLVGALGIAALEESWHSTLRNIEQAVAGAPGLAAVRYWPWHFSRCRVTEPPGAPERMSTFEVKAPYMTGPVPGRTALGARGSTTPNRGLRHSCWASAAATRLPGAIAAHQREREVTHHRPLSVLGHWRFKPSLIASSQHGAG